MKYLKVIVLALLLTGAFSLVKTNAVVIGYTNITIPALGKDYITGEEKKETTLAQNIYTVDAKDSIGGNQRGVKARSYGMYSNVGYSDWVVATKNQEVIITSPNNANQELGYYKLFLRATTTNSLTSIKYWGVWSVK